MEKTTKFECLVIPRVYGRETKRARTLTSKISYTFHVRDILRYIIISVGGSTFTIVTLKPGK